MYSTSSNRKQGVSALVFLPLTAFFILILAETSHAHRVNIFAWQEGNAITAQVYWANGRKAPKAEITVSDPDGATVSSGVTDREGLFTFKPDTDGLFIITVKAGEGHAAKTSVDFKRSTGQGGNFTHAGPYQESGPERSMPAPPYSAGGAGAETAAAPPGQEPPASCLTQEQMLQALDSRLQPLIRQIAALREREDRVRPQDIIGGIGYIIGIAGAALWASARKQSGQ